MYIMASDSDVDALSITSTAIAKLQSKLPQYVVNCFVAASYDSLEVVADVDVQDLRAIQTFVSEQYPKYSHNGQAQTHKISTRTPEENFKVC